MIETFFTSDTHFGHARVLEYDERPWGNVYDMGDALIENWNRVVGPADTVYHLGDVALCSPREKYEGVVRDFLSRTNGTKILVRGNHDGSLEKMVELGFDMAVDDFWLETPVGPVYLTHVPYESQISRQNPHRGILIKPSPTRLHVRHGPHLVLCGHVHSRWCVQRDYPWTYINVGVDQWGYTPVTLEDALNVVRNLTLDDALTAMKRKEN